MLLTYLTCMLKIAIFLQTPHQGPGTFPTAKKWKKQEFPTCVQNNGGDCAHSPHSFASSGPISFSSVYGDVSRSGATHFCQQRQNYSFFASGGPISFNSERNGGKNAAKNPWFLDFLPPLAAVFWFVRNVEMTYFSERCRFYSEMRRCAVLHFGRSAAAGTEADQFRISGGLHFAASACDAERQAPMCGA